MLLRGSRASSCATMMMIAMKKTTPQWSSAFCRSPSTLGPSRDTSSPVKLVALQRGWILQIYRKEMTFFAECAESQCNSYCSCQVYAAIEGREHAFHRTLFVFMCLDMACLHKDRENQLNASQEKLCRSVKVFRCQLCRINQFYSKDPPKNNGLDNPFSRGVPLCSWCGTWKGEKICGGCKKARYCSRQHQLEHWKSSHSTACKAQAAYAGKPSENLEDKLAKAELTSAPQQADVNLPASTKLWPVYEIVDEEEGCDEGSTSSGNTAIIGSGKEDDISRQFQEVQPSLEQQHWASFQARLARAPGQVLRYCRSQDAKPLWPRLDERPTSSSIPACPLCNSRRIFEFQILPQLLYFFKAPNDADALDWGTLAVYTCDVSCLSSKAYMEEFVWVQPA